MKKICMVGCMLAASVLVGCNSKTDTKTVAESPKNGQVIVYVDMDSLGENFKLFKEKRAVIEKSKKDMESALQREGEAFEKEVYEFQQKAQYMTQTEGEAAQQRLVNKKDALDRKSLQMQESLQTVTQKFSLELTEKLDSFIVEYNADKRYAYILSYAKGGSILYKDTSYDITAAVIKGLNEKYPPAKK